MDEFNRGKIRIKRKENESDKVSDCFNDCDKITGMRGESLTKTLFINE